MVITQFGTLPNQVQDYLAMLDAARRPPLPPAPPPVDTHRSFAPRRSPFGAYGDPDMLAQYDRLRGLLSGRGADLEADAFQTPHWQDIENLKWLAELINSAGSARGAYMGDLFAAGQAGQAPFGAFMPGGAINLPKLFITPPKPDPIEVPNIGSSPAHSYRYNRLMGADALRRYLQGHPMPTTTVYPWRPPVNPQSVVGFQSGRDGGDGGD